MKEGPSERVDNLAIRIAVVIPARMASSRFPGKPLVRIRNLPMIEHVRRRALLCPGFTEHVVATCDQPIAEVVRAYGGRVIMTSPDHPGAVDRIAEAVEGMDCTHVVNLQGDEVLVLPQDLEKLIEAVRLAPGVKAWTAVAPIERREELGDPSWVKCILSRSGRIAFCTRDFTSLPVSAEKSFRPVHKILGVSVFRKDFLAAYLALERTPLEMAEAIDQSRLIEHDIVIQGIRFAKGYTGINYAKEVPLVESCLDEDALQGMVLRQILSQEALFVSSVGGTRSARHE